jgi:hypothetical protein
MKSSSGSEGITEDKWIRKSQKGELCGILGCPHPPTNQCLKCKNYYCYGHLDLHVHSIVTNEKEANK